MILDAGFLISIDRSERSAHTFVTAATRSETDLLPPVPVVAPAWRNVSRHAPLAPCLKTI